MKETEIIFLISYDGFEGERNDLMQYKYFLQIKAICVCVYVCVLACSCMWVCVCVFLHASKKPFAIKTVGRKVRKLRGGIIIYLIFVSENKTLFIF